MIQDDYEKEVDNLEQEAKFQIIQLDDQVDEQTHKRVMDDAKEEMTRLYKEFRDWLSKNINSEETSERLERLKQETTNLINRTKTSVHEFNDREQVKANKEKAKEFGNKIVDTVNDGVAEVLKNEHVTKVVDTISDTIDHVASDERIVQGVKRFKKGTLKIAESAFEGLKKVLNSDDDRSSGQKG